MFILLVAMSFIAQTQVILFPPTEQKQDDFLTAPVPPSVCDAIRREHAGNTVAGITFSAAIAGGAIIGVLGSHYGESRSEYRENMGLTGALIGSFIGSLLGYVPAAIWTPCYVKGY